MRRAMSAAEGTRSGSSGRHLSNEKYPETGAEMACNLSIRRPAEEALILANDSQLVDEADIMGPSPSSWPQSGQALGRHGTRVDNRSAQMFPMKPWEATAAATPLPFQCEVCQKVFAKRHNLNAHQQVHRGVKKYTCDWPDCGKMFDSRHFQRHKRTHTGEKAVKCDWPDCEKWFSRNDHLRHHQATHTAEYKKLKKCTFPGCDAAYVQKGSFKKHMNTHQPQDKVHSNLANSRHPSAAKSLDLRLSQESGKTTAPAESQVRRHEALSNSAEGYGFASELGLNSYNMTH